nr:transposase [Gracilibacillus lacisalsi]
MKVHEDTPTYIDHDQLFKQLIGTFFDEFIEVFFPSVHQQLDFSSLKPLSDEVFTDLIHGERRRADIVMEGRLKEQDTLIIIHVESQSYEQKNFHERMYHYFSILYNRYRKPIIPIAVFSYDKVRDEQDYFELTFPFLHVLTFHFLKIELKKQDWRSFLRSNNPVAAALLSKMGYKNSEKVQVKKEFLRMLAKLELDAAKMELIYGFFETYVKLNQIEEDKLMESIQNSNDESLEEFVKKLPNSWRDKGLREGREKGLAEGREIGKQIGKQIGQQIGQQIGREEGEKIAKKEMAKKMLSKGMQPEYVMEITGLTKEELENFGSES